MLGRVNAKKRPDPARKGRIRGVAVVCSAHSHFWAAAFSWFS